MGVFLGYASDKGAALVDRALYVPQEWADDRERCRAAGIPDAVEFQTKPELARQMIGRALDAGVPVGWVTGDEVYGIDSKVRRMLEVRQVSYVLAVACNQHLWWPDFQQQRVDAIAQSLPKRAWKRLSAGSGSKGERLYDWALMRLSEQQGWARTLLVRRSRGEKLEHAFYLCYAPTAKSTLALLVRVAGQRWQIEQCFETAKGECGLDHYEVRHWQGWQRHITLHPTDEDLSVGTPAWPCWPTPCWRCYAAEEKKTLPGGVRLSVPEVRHLLTRLLWHGKHSLQHVLDWSNWRRAHQLMAIFYHYRKRQSPLPDCF